MSIIGPYIHRIDPIFGTIFGVHLWWYGLSYTLGFLNAFLFIKRKRDQFGLSMQTAYNLSLLLAIGVILGGRFIEVVFYEWPFYREHLLLIPAYWLGGMSTHGLLFGGLVGILVFSLISKKHFLSVTDMLSIPAAVIMGLGRLGNFIDGQIVGSVTTTWWAVKFPDAEGFRHPVVLYDGLKNLLIVPVLMFMGKVQPPRGVRTGIFLFLYAFLRIFVDIFREYPTTLLGLATGQVLNISMSILGLSLIIIPYIKRPRNIESTVQQEHGIQDCNKHQGLGWRQLMFACLLLFSLVMPSDWTQDIPARYGMRHECLTYSTIYPKLNTSTKKSEVKIELKKDGEVTKGK
jgi:phosphatidylglycerol:prolipoprotein diacylglycerol transferase